MKMNSTIVQGVPKKNSLTATRQVISESFFGDTLYVPDFFLCPWSELEYPCLGEFSHT